jgi:AmiR/NasT family two-component response regulator
VSAGSSSDRGSALSQRVAAARVEFEANAQRLDDTRSRLLATWETALAGRSQRELLHESAFFRLRARLESLPVIEQAKGILMAQTHCTSEQAFDLLRRASQRSNVRVRDLAAQIVEGAASGSRPGGSGVPHR